jgi:hypothetical protein
MSILSIGTCGTAIVLKGGERALLPVVCVPRGLRMKGKE